MPTKSPYVVDLTAEQRQALEDRARRYTLPYRGVVRAKIVLMAAAGLDNDELRPASTCAGRSSRSAIMTTFGPSWGIPRSANRCAATVCASTNSGGSS